MGAQFPAVEFDNAIRCSTLSRMSSFLWHSSKWVWRFGRFLQYTPGLEVLAYSLDTDLNYVTLVMPQLHPFLNHEVKLLQLLGEDAVTIWVYSHRQIRNQTALSPGPEALC